MKPNDMEYISVALKRIWPSLDIRIDQCDIVRVILQQGLIGVEYQDDVFHASLVRFDSNSDFEETVEKEGSFRQMGLLIEEIKYWLNEVKVTGKSEQ
jgi:ureidoglycolate hydrolase